MRVLLDQAVHDHRNTGNNALLEVALRRVRARWPDASIDVISVAPHLCRTLFPGTHPVDPVDLREAEDSLRVLRRLAPRPFWYLLFGLRSSLRLRFGLDLALGRMRLANLPRVGSAGRALARQSSANAVSHTVAASPPADPAQPDYRTSISGYDLYMPTGGGYLCDSDRRFLYPLFDRLQAAVAQGVSVAMVGQGIGPLEDPALLARAREALPLIDYIMIREERIARPILRSLNVPPSKVMMTGDDAIELAYRYPARRRRADGIGLSLRVAQYTQLGQRDLESIRQVMLRAASRHRAELIAVPIDVNEADTRYLKQVTQGYPHRRLPSGLVYYDTRRIIELTSHCRLMVAGTFHGAVFALSQGIPVVALARSAEYYAKLAGLSAEFGQEACQVISLDNSDLDLKLAEAIDYAWSSADKLRDQLLQNASRQVASGRAAYDKAFDLVEERARSQAKAHSLRQETGL